MPFTSQKTFTVQSPLQLDEAAVRLSEAVGSPEMARAVRVLRPFVGHFDGRQFDVMMSTRGRNSFRPRIRGALESSGRGTRITGTLQLHRAVLVFLLLFLSLPLSLSGSVLFGGLDSGRPETTALVIPAVLMLFVTAVALAFAYEKRRAVRALTALFDGESLTPSP